MLAVVRTGYATFVREWTANLRIYNWSFFISGLSNGFLTATIAYFFYHLLGAEHLNQSFASYAGTSDYMSYVILGACILTFSLRIILGVGRSLFTEVRSGTLESLSITPAQRSGYFMGITFQYMLIGLFETGVMLLISWPLGLRLSQVHLATLLLALPITLLGLSSIAIMLGALILLIDDSYITQNTLFRVILLFCGFFFPPNYLPLPLQWIADVIPVTDVLHLLRATLLTGATPSLILGDLLKTALLGLVYMVIGLILTRFAEKRILEGK